MNMLHAGHPVGYVHWVMPKCITVKVGGRIALNAVSVEYIHLLELN